MRSVKKKKRISLPLKKRLSDLEQKILKKGIIVHYDLLEASGLKLKGGLCKFNGEFHLFIDKRKSAYDKIEILNTYLAPERKLLISPISASVSNFNPQNT